MPAFSSSENWGFQMIAQVAKFAYMEKLFQITNLLFPVWRSDTNRPKYFN